ncbi:hypothetical protein H2198_000347 [Neophaeococcomyces mojaviensis]|uniref:Uncharacterized protein n=1 Tax=Neophaeococcomyces mojaviensis TaxID=3383035 RepID=A0ACC3AKB7_9EURO|nr:hypothetical protein H2198_000347 [Knufia sp. JES_112]
MTEMRSSFPIYPGRGLGWITIGASLHAVLTRLKAQPQLYPQLDLAYSATEPILDPIVLNLPSNGLRLRFDGPDQRLRLIELLDFSKSVFTYKSIELVRKTGASHDDPSEQVAGPSFKHLYNRLFGPSYPGEYIAPLAGKSQGTYILSWPGLAARFSLRPKSWSEKADFVSLLSSSATSPASSLAIFSGSSWPEVRPTLYSKRPNLPRSISLATKTTENIPDEIEEVMVHAGGKLELFRRTSVPLMVVLNETTPQDLVAELGPPDAIFRKSGSRISIQAGGISKNRLPSVSPTLDPHMAEHEHSSYRSYTDDSENEVSTFDEAQGDETSSEAFYNYFHHGFDVLVSTPDPSTTHDPERPHTPADFVVTKIFLHGNIPGSYAFNRHRRSRWRIALEPDGQPVAVTSEMRFQEASDILKQVYHDSYRDVEEEKRMQRGMVLNRGWGEGDSPESSIEFLGGFEEGPTTKMQTSARGGVDASMSNFNNTELFGFPGLLFEVLKNDSISCLTVYRMDP